MITLRMLVRRGKGVACKQLNGERTIPSVSAARSATIGTRPAACMCGRGIWIRAREGGRAGIRLGSAEGTLTCIGMSGILLPMQWSLPDLPIYLASHAFEQLAAAFASRKARMGKMLENLLRYSLCSQLLHQPLQMQKQAALAIMQRKRDRQAGARCRHSMPQLSRLQGK